MSIRRLHLPYIIVILALFTSGACAQWVGHVDPMIGTQGLGNVYPGPTLPWGFVQPGPDTGEGSGAGGYKFDKKINGFSQQHISGLGGPMYGEVSILPVVDDIQNPNELVSAGKSDETAEPGYYTVTLQPWGVKVELTSTRTVAVQRQTYPAGHVAKLVIDVAHCLYGKPLPATGEVPWNSAIATGGEVSVSKDGREISGHMTYKGARSTTQPWSVNFVTRVNTPSVSQATWGDDVTPIDHQSSNHGAKLGVVLNFDNSAGFTVETRTAVSWRSIEQARQYLDADSSGDFAAVRKSAAAAWDVALGKIAVEGGDADALKRFYTALYHAHLAPNDWTHESPQRYGDRTYYENQLCMWDQFRTVIPLLTLIEPKVATDIVNSIVNYYLVDGWTGDAHSAHQYEHVQNGSNADVIITDAYVKHLPGINWSDAYAAIRKNAFVDNDPTTISRPKRGRFHLDDYRKLHYVPADAAAMKKNDVQSVSRTLEYVYDDFCVWTLAKTLGAADDVKDLESRLTWYQSLWEPNDRFMRAKMRDGTWFTPFDPLKYETGKQYYEGHAWTWSWYVPHDVQGLINLNGGDAAFVEKLTTACDHYYEAFNEPCMLETFMFIHAGRPDLTQRFSRKALTNFSTARDGLPGNDDSGTTSAWEVWTMLGLYPNAGQPFYYIGSPVFPKATLDVGGGRSFVVTAADTSDTNLYVQSAKLNGEPLQQAWLTHDVLAAGGTLELQMGPTPSEWGRGARPPSISPAK